MSHSSVSDMDVTWHVEDVLEGVSDVPSIIERSEELLLKSPEQNQDQGKVGPEYEVITEDESSILDSDAPVIIEHLPLDLSMNSVSTRPTATCGSNYTPTTNITTGRVRFTDHPDYSGGHMAGNPSDRLGDRAAFHTWGVSPAALSSKDSTKSKMEVGTDPSPAMHLPCGPSRVVGVSDKVLPELAPLIRRFGRSHEGQKIVRGWLREGWRQVKEEDLQKNIGGMVRKVSTVPDPNVSFQPAGEECDVAQAIMRAREDDSRQVRVSECTRRNLKVYCTSGEESDGEPLLSSARRPRPSSKVSKLRERERRWSLLSRSRSRSRSRNTTKTVDQSFNRRRRETRSQTQHERERPSRSRTPKRRRSRSRRRSSSSQRFPSSSGSGVFKRYDSYSACANSGRKEEEIEVPWFADPLASCWLCSVTCNSHRLESHMREGHQGKFANNHLGRWAGYFKLFLTIASDYLGVYSLVALHEKVRKHLRGKRDMTSFAQELEKYFVVAMKESVVVGELLSVRGARAVLDAIKPEDRSKLRNIKEASELLETPSSKQFPRIVWDAHCHLDEWIKRGDPRAARSEIEGMQTYHCITSYAWAYKWHECEKAPWWSNSEGRRYISVGVHPKEASKTKWTERRQQQFNSLLSRRDCVAVGEAGLDLSKYVSQEQRQDQIFILRQMAKGAKKHQLPIVIHCRGSLETHKLCQRTLLEVLSGDHPVQLHHFAEGYVVADSWTNRFSNVLFSIPPVLNSGRQDRLEEFVASRSVSCLVPESDAPFANGGRSPFAAMGVAERIAKIKGIPSLLISGVFDRNVKRFFKKVQQ